MEIGQRYIRGETIRTPIEFLENGKFIKCRVEFKSGDTFEKYIGVTLDNY